MDTLSLYISQLKHINEELLFAIDCKVLEKDRVKCIDNIDNYCKTVKIYNDKEKEEFVELIKKYILVQEDYKKAKLHLAVTQLQIRDPNLTEKDCEEMIVSGNYRNALCVYNDVNDVYTYVTLRHKEIMKLEQSIQEVKELFIASYALVIVHKEQVDKIKDKVINAKNDVNDAKSDLTVAYKIKKKKWYNLF